MNGDYFDMKATLWLRKHLDRLRIIMDLVKKR
jgi:hypothetical protein